MTCAEKLPGVYACAVRPANNKTKAEELNRVRIYCTPADL